MSKQEKIKSENELVIEEFDRCKPTNFDLNLMLNVFVFRHSRRTRKKKKSNDENMHIQQLFKSTACIFIHSSRNSLDNFNDISVIYSVYNVSSLIQFYLCVLATNRIEL